MAIFIVVASPDAGVIVNIDVLFVLGLRGYVGQGGTLYWPTVDSVFYVGFRLATNYQKRINYINNYDCVIFIAIAIMAVMVNKILRVSLP